MGSSSKALKAPAADKAANLGIYAKSTTPPAGSGSVKGQRSPQKAAEKRQENRAERYRLQASARNVMLLEGQNQGLYHPHDYHRVCKCCRITHGQTQIYRSKEHGTAHYGGLITCGSVWACPVCAAKVQERRRDEIAQAIAWAYSSGFKVVMVTLTFPHQAWHKLGDLVTQQADALRRLRRGGPWDRLKDRAGYEGLIRSLELTYGQNGWHPHTHELWVVHKDCDAAWLQSRITERWRASCARAGLLPDNSSARSSFDAHAVDVIDNADTSDYLAKQDDESHWGADRELAKASTKAGRAKGLHPFGLLADYADGDEQAGQRFREYCEVMKGKRQVFWTHGLKNRVGIKDQTDEELAAREEDKADALAYLSRDSWHVVLKHDARAELLDRAERGGFSAIAAWFESKKAEPPIPPS